MVTGAALFITFERMRKRLFSPTQTIIITEISRTELRHRVEDGSVDCYRTPDGVFFDEEQIEKLKSEQEEHDES